MPKEAKTATRSSARIKAAVPFVKPEGSKPTPRKSAPKKAQKAEGDPKPEPDSDADVADSHDVEDSGADSGESLEFHIVNSDSCSTYKGQVKRVTRIISAAYPGAHIRATKGKFGSFDISLKRKGDSEEKILFEGSKLGPPRTLKWVEEGVLLGLIKDALA
ncbi:hypothetical protein HDU83_009769 [Entophlyctis luteolus]|nr:hypothetical protein HDU83_009769 [Entophlyctis luteolus]KAJ3390218.1 hypothetical protein HDU84_007788 [Entophlyctis sp. JEL0112]